MAAPMYNVFVGSEIGLLKGFKVNKSIWDNLNAVEEASKENEICAMCWGDKTQAKICVGLKSQKVLVLDTHDPCVEDEYSFDAGKGRIRQIFKSENNFVTAVSSGAVKMWKEKEEFRQIQAGDNLFCVESSPNKDNIFLTGGKENELKIWDWESSEKPIFQAKNVKDDWLCLRVPVWVLGAQFIPGTDKVVTSTGHHQVRLYDTKVQRRPVLDMNHGEYPLTALSLNPQNTNEVIVGNTHGDMALLDLRKGAMVQQYKGFSGGIRDIKCHETKSLIISCGLDRFMRVHDLKTRELLHKVYMKSKLNCLLISKKKWSSSNDENEIDNDKVEEDINEEKSGEEDADIWDNLEVVKTKTKRKAEIVSPDNKKLKSGNNLESEYKTERKEVNKRRKKTKQ